MPKFDFDSIGEQIAPKVPTYDKKEPLKLLKVPYDSDEGKEIAKIRGQIDEQVKKICEQSFYSGKKRAEEEGKEFKTGRVSRLTAEGLDLVIGIKNQIVDDYQKVAESKMTADNLLKNIKVGLEKLQNNKEEFLSKWFESKVVKVTEKGTPGSAIPHAPNNKWQEQVANHFTNWFNNNMKDKELDYKAWDKYVDLFDKMVHSSKIGGYSQAYSEQMQKEEAAAWNFKKTAEIQPIVDKIIASASKQLTKFATDIEEGKYERKEKSEKAETQTAEVETNSQTTEVKAKRPKA